MMRNKIRILLGYFCIVLPPLSAQVILRENCMSYWNDSIIIYQQPYIESDSGIDCIWDFSSFEETNAIKANYYTIASTEPNMLGKHQASEHIYYLEKSDSLFIIGRESSSHKVTYLIPEPVLKFPFQYGDTINEEYTINEVWGIGNSQVSYANVYVRADAKGTLILPTDTLDSILRVHTREEYKTINSDSRFLICHLWSWYSQSSCRPIVEMIKVLNNDSISAAYSLYYQLPNHSRKNKKHSLEHGNNENIETTICNSLTYSPNPVVADLSVSYILTTAVSNISFTIYSSGGICVYNSQLQNQSIGTHLIQIPMANLPQGMYTLCVNFGDRFVCKEIMKR